MEDEAENSPQENVKKKKKRRSREEKKKQIVECCSFIDKNSTDIAIECDIPWDFTIKLLIELVEEGRLVRSTRRGTKIKYPNGKDQKKAKCRFHYIRSYDLWRDF